MFRLITKIFTPKKTTLLGRWKLTTKINSIYQNRDTICKKPVKPDKYLNPDLRFVSKKL